MQKSADAFRTISEVAEWLDTPTHVLRFWESKFSQIKPLKRAGGRRYYRPKDMQLIGGIKKLLHDDGMTIKGVQKLLKEQGVKHVISLSQPLEDDLTTAPTQQVELEQAEAVEQTPSTPVAEIIPLIPKAENAQPSFFDEDEGQLNFWSDDETNEDSAADTTIEWQSATAPEATFESLTSFLSNFTPNTSQREDLKLVLVDMRGFLEKNG